MPKTWHVWDHFKEIIFNGSRWKILINNNFYLTGFPHHVMTFQDDKEYPGKVYSSGSSSTLLLKGIVDERGEYVCRWNNSLGELRQRNFTVIFAGTEISATTIPISVNLAALIFIIGIAIKLYLDKVLFFFYNDTALCLFIILRLFYTTKEKAIISGSKEATWRQRQTCQSTIVNGRANWAATLR